MADSVDAGLDAFDFCNSLTNVEKEILSSMIDTLHAPTGVSRSDFVYRCLCFLRANKFDAAKAGQKFRAHLVWRERFNVDQLNISHVSSHFASGKFLYSGFSDVDGRPFVIYNARLHTSSIPFVETLRAVVYMLELAERQCGVQAQVCIIENLTSFSKRNKDVRMGKFLLEFVQAHYPGRLGKLYLVNAPFFYKLLFRVVRPVIPASIAKVVSMDDGISSLKNQFPPHALPRELGGTMDFDVDAWLRSRADEEDVDLLRKDDGGAGDDIDGDDDDDDGGGGGDDHRHPHHSIHPHLLDTLLDRPSALVEPGCLCMGYLRKRGNWVKRFNQRWCILHPHILYYYKAREDPYAEGYVELVHASITQQDPSAGTFTITTMGLKEAIFSSNSSDELAQWVSLVEKCIARCTASFIAAQTQAASMMEPIQDGSKCGGAQDESMSGGGRPRHREKSRKTRRNKHSSGSSKKRRRKKKHAMHSGGDDDGSSIIIGGASSSTSRIVRSNPSPSSSSAWVMWDDGIDCIWKPVLLVMLYTLRYILLFIVCLLPAPDQNSVLFVDFASWNLISTQPSSMLQTRGSSDHQRRANKHKRRNPTRAHVSLDEGDRTIRDGKCVRSDEDDGGARTPDEERCCKSSVRDDHEDKGDDDDDVELNDDDDDNHCHDVEENHHDDDDDDDDENNSDGDDGENNSDDDDDYHRMHHPPPRMQPTPRSKKSGLRASFRRKASKSKVLKSAPALRTLASSSKLSKSTVPLSRSDTAFVFPPHEDPT